LAKFLDLKELGRFNPGVSPQILEVKAVAGKFFRNKGLGFWRWEANAVLGMDCFDFSQLNTNSNYNIRVRLRALIDCRKRLQGKADKNIFVGLDRV
jgi:hypothetical protein